MVVHNLLELNNNGACVFVRPKKIKMTCVCVCVIYDSDFRFQTYDEVKFF